MSELDLGSFRRLRGHALELLADQATDIGQFLHKKDRLTFRRRPEQRSTKGDVKVTTSCSCIMSLALSSRLQRVYPQDAADNARRAFLRIFRASWRSAGLGLNNAFSTVLVIRTFGFLVEAGIIEKGFASTELRRYTPLGRTTMRGIARWLASDIKRFQINRYPATAALLYWFLDGVIRGGIGITASQCRSFCAWAQKEFNHQRSLVLAGHEALMDPVAMAMAACLCARLRKFVEKTKSEPFARTLRLLPSRVELGHAISTLFDHQAPSGIWRKYFPLFHYPKAGSNFCFTFEMLEAVLVEFGSPDFEHLDDAKILKGLSESVNWCSKNRLAFMADRVTYTGWNSGGELDSLNDEKPESWATAVVHMFLWELQHVLAVKIHHALLKQYDSRPVSSDDLDWRRLLDIDVRLQGGSQTRVKTILERQIIKSASKFRSFAEQKIDGRVSALLFGPPGTSKTHLAGALASKLGWPFVLIDPSRFLSKGLEQIYGQADEIFSDLSDLSGVVVLFDEMDALVRGRGEKQPLDITSRFLTTSMLPKLAALHDQANLVFFFATNYQEDFDLAIKRPGRFDILLCVGPPSWKEKLKYIDRFLPDQLSALEVEKIKRKLKRLYGFCNTAERELLALLTFKELKTFFENLGGNTTADRAIQKMKSATFKKRLGIFGRYITLRPAGEDYARFQRDRQESRLQ